MSLSLHWDMDFNFSDGMFLVFVVAFVWLIIEYFGGGGGGRRIAPNYLPGQ